ncbi:MAG: hypothetical protein U9Q06_04565 [Nanoarchaeota archaeon]|nr:hypothetical protein [Nanoarchaeota archaeon]
MIEQLEFSVSEEWKKFARENSWASFILETARDPDGVEYHRKKGSQIAYRKVEDGFECVECGSEIQAGRVAHPIWDGPFPMSGSGKCHYKQVPYCPKCEKEPNFHGSPIQCQIK